MYLSGPLLNGRNEGFTMVQLTSIPSGNTVKVAQFHGQRQAQLLRDMGMFEGEALEMLRNGRSGPLLVKLGQVRIALGRGMAEKVLVHQE